MKFAYRESGLKGCVVVRAKINVKGVSNEESRSIRQRYRDERGSKQPVGVRSAGSIFKNPDNSIMTAGQWIDKAGLKGMRVGGAEISGVHANFIVNRADATANDILRLIERIKKTVKDEFSVELETELKIVNIGGLGAEEE